MFCWRCIFHWFLDMPISNVNSDIHHRLYRTNQRQQELWKLKISWSKNMSTHAMHVLLFCSTCSYYTLGEKNIFFHPLPVQSQGLTSEYCSHLPSLCSVEMHVYLTIQLDKPGIFHGVGWMSCTLNSQNWIEWRLKIYWPMAVFVFLTVTDYFRT